MSKILYIGNYRDNTSFGRLCRDYILGLIECGHEVVCRPYIHALGGPLKLDSRIEEAENKSSDGTTVCVQQVPIEDAVLDYRFKKQIFIFSTLRSWTQSDLETLNRFRDCTILAMNYETWSLFSGLADTNNITLREIEYPSFVVEEKFQKETEQLEFLNNDNFKFYFIGKLSARKNLNKIVEAFHLAFSKDDPVDLVIKTSTDIDPLQAGEIISQNLNTIKQNLGKYPNITDYKREIIVTGNSEDENLVQLHKSCDCFISVSSREFQDHMVRHARMAGNVVICGPDVGRGDFITNVLMYEEYSYAAPSFNLTNYQTGKFDTGDTCSVLDLKNAFLRTLKRHKRGEKRPIKYTNQFKGVINAVL